MDLFGPDLFGPLFDENYLSKNGLNKKDEQELQMDLLVLHTYGKGPCSNQLAGELLKVAKWDLNRALKNYFMIRAELIDDHVKAFQRGMLAINKVQIIAPIALLLLNFGNWNSKVAASFYFWYEDKLKQVLDTFAGGISVDADALKKLEIYIKNDQKERKRNKNNKKKKKKKYKKNKRYKKKRKNINNIELLPTEGNDKGNMTAILPKELAQYQVFINQEEILELKLKYNLTSEDIPTPKTPNIPTPNTPNIPTPDEAPPAATPLKPTQPLKPTPDPTPLPNKAKSPLNKLAPPSQLPLNKSDPTPHAPHAQPSKPANPTPYDAKPSLTHTQPSKLAPDEAVTLPKPIQPSTLVSYDAASHMHTQPPKQITYDAKASLKHTPPSKPAPDKASRTHTPPSAASIPPSKPMLCDDDAPSTNTSNKSNNKTAISQSNSNKLNKNNKQMVIHNTNTKKLNTSKSKNQSSAHDIIPSNVMNNMSHQYNNNTDSFNNNIIQFQPPSIALNLPSSTLISSSKPISKNDVVVNAFQPPSIPPISSPKPTSKNDATPNTLQPPSNTPDPPTNTPNPPSIKLKPTSKHDIPLIASQSPSNTPDPPSNILKPTLKYDATSNPTVKPTSNPTIKPMPNNGNASDILNLSIKPTLNIKTIIETANVPSKPIQNNINAPSKPIPNNGNAPSKLIVNNDNASNITTTFEIANAPPKPIPNNGKASDILNSLFKSTPNIQTIIETANAPSKPIPKNAHASSKSIPKNTNTPSKSIPNDANVPSNTLNTLNTLKPILDYDATLNTLQSPTNTPDPPLNTVKSTSDEHATSNTLQPPLSPITYINAASPAPYPPAKSTLNDVKSSRAPSPPSKPPERSKELVKDNIDPRDRDKYIMDTMGKYGLGGGNMDPRDRDKDKLRDAYGDGNEPRDRDKFRGYNNYLLVNMNDMIFRLSLNNWYLSAVGNPSYVIAALTTLTLNMLYQDRDSVGCGSLENAFDIKNLYFVIILLLTAVGYYNFYVVAALTTKTLNLLYKINTEMDFGIIYIFSKQITSGSDGNNCWIGSKEFI